MKNIHSYIIIGLSAILFTSCQDVIDIELREADRKYVIEGSVVQGVDSVVVRVSRTTSFFETTGPEAITDAEVVLTLPDGFDRRRAGGARLDVGEATLGIADGAHVHREAARDAA